MSHDSLLIGQRLSLPPIKGAIVCAKYSIEFNQYFINTVYNQ